MEFKQYYQKEIAPLANKLYRAARKGAIRSVIAKLVVISIVAFLVYLNTTQHFISSFWGWFTFSLVSIVVFTVASMPFEIKKASIRFTVLPKLVPFIPGLTFNDTRYGKITNERLELMKTEFLYPNHYDYNSCILKILGNYEKSFEIDLISLNIKDKDSNNQTTLKYPTAQILAKSNNFINGHVLIVEEFLDTTDRDIWQEKNLKNVNSLSLADGKKYNVLTNNENDYEQCISEPFITELNTLIAEIQDVIIKTNHIFCSFHEDKFLLVIMINENSNLFNLNYTKGKFLEPENLIPILDQIKLFTKVANAC